MGIKFIERSPSCVWDPVTSSECQVQGKGRYPGKGQNGCRTHSAGPISFVGSDDSSEHKQYLQGQVGKSFTCTQIPYLPQTVSKTEIAFLPQTVSNFTLHFCSGFAAQVEWPNSSEELSSQRSCVLLAAQSHSGVPKASRASFSTSPTFGSGTALSYAPRVQSFTSGLGFDPENFIISAYSQSYSHSLVGSSPWQ